MTPLQALTEAFREVTDWKYPDGAITDEELGLTLKRLEQRGYTLVRDVQLGKQKVIENPVDETQITIEPWLTKVSESEYRDFVGDPDTECKVSSPPESPHGVSFYKDGVRVAIHVLSSRSFYIQKKEIV
ncbi:MAG: hypothetical protein CMF04_11335 [Hyphomonas sp.]|nr:hypothetical protein [Hyphomonas sp.]|tara:strand:- start:6545 stop:6931 length:387 start_codon:yes stop_codon:yes gene_type:complete